MASGSSSSLTTRLSPRFYAAALVRQRKRIARTRTVNPVAKPSVVETVRFRPASCAIKNTRAASAATMAWSSPRSKIRVALPLKTSRSDRSSKSEGFRIAPNQRFRKNDQRSPARSGDWAQTLYTVQRCWRIQENGPDLRDSYLRHDYTIVSAPAEQATTFDSRLPASGHDPAVSPPSLTESTAPLTRTAVRNLDTPCETR